MTTILDGKALSLKITEKLSIETKSMIRKPKLAVVLVGNNPASQIYVRNKEKTAIKIGMHSLVLPLPEDISEQNLIEQINILNGDNDIDGILVQLPLPNHINEAKILEIIDPMKDVDGFHPINAGKLMTGQKPFAIPCTPKGIIELLNEYKVDIAGKNALVIGRSNIVGKPIAQLLLNKNATVTIAHSKTKNIEDIAKTMDIIVCAIGKPAFLTAEMVKENAVIIDVGINRVDGKLKGDVDFEKVKPKTSFITPVPGGVGPMTIAMLMQNTVNLYKLHN
ncbi:MAG: bifunctional methylenetetrahydrofolate dehydrogenase/methenyltetrahydrofolate cyclohydrolase FolD [Candidatus Gastranaerophilales bacterium]|nr:bifunctional methylenetetrahydrofolate dehydrogenase/methenyltetrahydrofolate cyclohydrolase FolD [Candidatus Gastranaerophilales bacterium]